MMTVDEALSFADRMYTKSSFAGVLAAEVRRLREENERLRKDAERWVFYRSTSNDITLRLHNSRPDVRDATIDAARGAK